MGRDMHASLTHTRRESKDYHLKVTTAWCALHKMRSCPDIIDYRPFKPWGQYVCPFRIYLLVIKKPYNHKYTLNDVDLSIIMVCLAGRYIWPHHPKYKAKYIEEHKGMIFHNVNTSYGLTSLKNLNRNHLLAIMYHGNGAMREKITKSANHVLHY